MDKFKDEELVKINKLEKSLKLANDKIKSLELYKQALADARSESNLNKNNKEISNKYTNELEKGLKQEELNKTKESITVLGPNLSIKENREVKNKQKNKEELNRKNSLNKDISTYDINSIDNMLRLLYNNKNKVSHNINNLLSNVQTLNKKLDAKIQNKELIYSLLDQTEGFKGIRRYSTYINKDRLIDSKFNMSLIKGRLLRKSLGVKRSFYNAANIKNTLTTDEVINSIIRRKDNIKKISINKGNYSINSPMHLNLLNILLSNPHDVNTQLLIENVLIDQSNFILEKNLSKTKDINYVLFNNNPDFFNVLKDKRIAIENILNRARLEEIKVKDKNEENSRER